MANVPAKIGQIVKHRLNGETAWCKIVGDHNDDGFQARIMNPLEQVEFSIGDFIRIPRDKILGILPDDDCD